MTTKRQAEIDRLLAEAYFSRSLNDSARDVEKITMLAVADGLTPSTAAGQPIEHTVTESAEIDYILAKFPHLRQSSD